MLLLVPRLIVLLPSELVLSAGLFGWPFALLYFAGATGLGFAAGGVAGLLEDRGLLVGQARLRAAKGGCDERADRSTGAEATGRQPGAACRYRCGDAYQALHEVRTARQPDAAAGVARRVVAHRPPPAAVLRRLQCHRLPDTRGRSQRRAGQPPRRNDDLERAAGRAARHSGLRHLSEGSLPMVAALMSGGLGSGSAMAFLITGAGTSLPAISGALVIARYRVVALVVALLRRRSRAPGWRRYGSAALILRRRHGL